MLNNSNMLTLDNLIAFSKNHVLSIEKQFFNSQIMFNFQIINQMKKKIKFFSKKFADGKLFLSVSPAFKSFKHPIAYIK